MTEVVRCKPMTMIKATPEAIREVVGSSDKQRFKIIWEEERELIRANQGHSFSGLDMDLLCKAVTVLNPGEVCCHGTFRRLKASIQEKGLIGGGLDRENFKRDIHFSVKHPRDDTVISGMRETCSLVVYLDFPKAVEDGMKFYRSDNDVILTSGVDGVVPPKYFKHVVEIHRDKPFVPPPGVETPAPAGAARPQRPPPPKLPEDAAPATPTPATPPKRPPPVPPAKAEATMPERAPPGGRQPVKPQPVQPQPPKRDPPRPPAANESEFPPLGAVPAPDAAKKNRWKK
mmetsp:Transcript_139545/g.313642  ORF Transcript_139545/g.313642 Transcript_139545/m.313642 type:complete len:287 (-) Transcript_139545:71-931(-)